MSWVHKTAVEQRAALGRGEISSLELLQATIAHLEDLAPYLNPIAVRLYDRARASALAADKKLARRKGGPLCGIPVTIKDSQWMAGVPCTNGSLTLQNFVPEETSLSIQRLEAAGAVVFAKTTCPELSLSGVTESAAYGRTCNPWDISRTPGGSSGGAGAAVAAGIGSLSLGSDGGGSIRIPSGFCGITGFKPSHGVIPRQPGFTTWESIVSYGPMARTVADASLMFSVLADLKIKKEKPKPKPASPVTGARTKQSFIVSEDLGFAPVDADIRSAFREAVAKIENAGNTVKYDHPGLTSSAVTWATTATYDMWKHKAPVGKSSRTAYNAMSDNVKEFIDFGGSFTETDYEDAQLDRVRIHNAYLEMFRRNRTSILVTPTLGCEAFPHGTTYPAMIESTEITYPWLDWAGFLYDANLTGMPACSLPMGIGDEGLPLSLQVMGPPGHDAEVLIAAQAIEELLGWQQPEFGAEHYASTAYPDANITVKSGSAPEPAAVYVA